MDGLRWSSDGRVLVVTAEDGGFEKLFSVNPATGDVSALTESGHVSDFDTVGRMLVYARDSLQGPAQFYRVASEAPVQLTQADEARLAGVELARPVQFTFAGWNNETVHGFAMPLAGAKEGVKYPVAFLIHAGPQGSFGDSWSYRWNPQTYAG